MKQNQYWSFAKFYKVKPLAQT